jgi:hypothetical protein
MAANDDETPEVARKYTMSDSVYKGHKVIVEKDTTGTFYIRSNILDEQMTAETEGEKDKKLKYLFGYIDGWKAAGGN